MSTTDLAPAYRDRAIVRDLQTIGGKYASVPADHGYPCILPAKYGAALDDDPALLRFAQGVRAGDWHRIADADPDDLAARLPEWREQGRVLLERDHAMAVDFVAALEGDEDALDRLRASDEDGGWLAQQVPRACGSVNAWRGWLSDPQRFREELGELAADEWHAEHDADAEEEACGYR